MPVRVALRPCVAGVAPRSGLLEARRPHGYDPPRCRCPDLPTGSPASPPSAGCSSWARAVRSPSASSTPTPMRSGWRTSASRPCCGILNDDPRVTVERAFLPDGPRPGWPRTLRTFESDRPLGDFDVVAFSISFETDYLHVLDILAARRAAAAARRRAGRRAPLVLGGGPATFLNPEPIADFVDLFLIGEARGDAARVPRPRRRGRAAGAPGCSSAPRTSSARIDRIAYPPALRPATARSPRSTTMGRAPRVGAALPRGARRRRRPRRRS